MPTTASQAAACIREALELPKSRACLWVTDNPRHCNLLRPAPNVVNAFPWPAGNKSEADQLYWREKGFWQEPLFTADQMHAYADDTNRALLAERDELREDAARYRLIRAGYCALSLLTPEARPEEGLNYREVAIRAELNFGNSEEGEALDKFIDARRALNKDAK